MRLKEELELMTKVEIHEIEERKNKHINELMKSHQEAFKEMKEYYNDITKENLELIRLYNDRHNDIMKQIEQNKEMVEHLRQEMTKLKEPLAEKVAERERYQKQLANFKKDVMALRNAKARLEVLKTKEIKCKADKAELEDKFIKV